MISKFPGGKSTIHQTDEEDRVIAYLTPQRHAGVPSPEAGSFRIQRKTSYVGV